ncbi:MAG: hypothetical protein COX62_01650, partial [Deltaproteobacteria bacterium CG_4_10_14_0_2_um_filter_43_8]
MKRTRLVFIFVFLFSFLSSFCFAQDAGDGQVENLPGADASGDSSGVSNANFEPDYFTGAATYRYDIELPQGRQGMTPKLTLMYNSQRRSKASEVGIGWELNLRYIQRSLIDGTPNYAGDDYVSYEQGQSRQLIATGERANSCDEYRYKVEGEDQKRFFKCQNTWTMYDKTGKQYLFGQEPESRLEDNDQIKTFRWYLATVKDPNGNTIHYQMSGHFLSSIEYTGHQNESGKFRIEFRYEDNEYITKNFQAGFRVTLPKRLSSVIVFEQGVSGVQQYVFRYDTEGGTIKLAGILKRAWANRDNVVTELPEIRFEYSSLENERYWNAQRIPFRDPLGAADVVDKHHKFLDMNGDGLLDHVFEDRAIGSFAVYFNTGTDFEAQPHLWPDICNGPCNDEDDNDLIDMNGDGLPDRILGGRINITGEPEVFEGYFVQYNNGSGWSYAERWNDPACQSAIHRDECGKLNFRDMNGDGLRDRIIHDEARNVFLVYRNLGRSFSVVADEWIDPSPETEGVKVYLIDMNGDGLPDRVANSGSIDVYYNTGYGWSDFRERWDAPLHFSGGQTSFQDMNGDGRVDLVTTSSSPDALPRFLVYYNLGTAFADDAEILEDPIQDDQLSNHFSYENGLPGLLDLNGDGYPDRIAPVGNDAYAVHFTKFDPEEQPAYQQPPQALSVINNGLGVETHLYYSPSSKLHNRSLPFHQFNLTKIVQREGDEEKVTNIDYAMGQFYFPWGNPKGRKFDGFGFVRIRDSLGNVEKRWYHQSHNLSANNIIYVDDAVPSFDYNPTITPRSLEQEISIDGIRPWTYAALSGKLYRVSRYIRKPENAALVHKDVTTYQWDVATPLHHTTFAYLARKKMVDYEGAAAGRTSSISFSYSVESGNKTSILNLGEEGVDIPRLTRYSALQNIATDFGALPTSFVGITEIFERNGHQETLKNRVETNYDARLNLRERQVLLQYAGEADQTLHTSYEYDEYGNVIRITNPKNVITTLSYDNILHALPTSTTVAGEFTFQAEYNIRVGKITRSVAPDGRVSTFSYDGFGRLLERTFQNQWQERFVYDDHVDFGDGLFGTIVKRFTNISSDAGSDIHARQVIHRNGQGKIIQVSTLSEKSNGSYRTSYTRYLQNQTSNIIYTSEPFFTPNANRVEAVGHPELTIERDSLGRTFR